jgi:hypothetical protein
MLYPLSKLEINENFKSLIGSGMGSEDGVEKDKTKKTPPLSNFYIESEQKSDVELDKDVEEILKIIDTEETMEEIIEKMKN